MKTVIKLIEGLGVGSCEYDPVRKELTLEYRQCRREGRSISIGSCSTTGDGGKVVSSLLTISPVTGRLSINTLGDGTALAFDKLSKDSVVESTGEDLDDDEDEEQ